MNNYTKYKDELIQALYLKFKVDKEGHIQSCDSQCDNCIFAADELCWEESRTWLYDNWEAQAAPIRLYACHEIGVNYNTNIPFCCTHANCKRCIHYGSFDFPCYRTMYLWLNSDKE